MPWYPHAERVPWRYAEARPSYWRGVNAPAAAVLHRLEGYEATVRRWAAEGYAGASWHFTVTSDGRVLQHLAFEDGGFHAGLAAVQARAAPPSWPLWRGVAVNVNHYTLGVEHEGFAGTAFTPAQAEASRDLCRWLAAQLGVPLDRAHFPAHAEIDRINRAHDFNPPQLRDEHYAYLLDPSVQQVESQQREEAGIEVQRVPLSQGRSIALIDVLNRTAGQWIADDLGSGAYEVTSGVPLGAQQRAFLIVIDVTRVNLEQVD